MRTLSGPAASTQVFRGAVGAILLLRMPPLGRTPQKHLRPRPAGRKGHLSHRPGCGDRQPSHVDRLRSEFVRARRDSAKRAACVAHCPDGHCLGTARPPPAPRHLGLRLPPHLRPRVAVRFGGPGCLRGLVDVEPQWERARVLRGGGRTPHSLQRGQGTDGPGQRTSTLGDSTSERHLRHRPAHRTTRPSGEYSGNRRGRPDTSAARRTHPCRWRGHPGRRFRPRDTADRRTRTGCSTRGGSCDGRRLQRRGRTHR